MLVGGVLNFDKCSLEAFLRYDIFLALKCDVCGVLICQYVLFSIPSQLVCQKWFLFHKDKQRHVQLNCHDDITVLLPDTIIKCKKI